MPQNSLDLASFIAAIFGVFVTPQLAHVMGVYAAIIIGAVFGAGLALVRAEEMTRWRSSIFLLLMAGTSTITTVGAAEVINHWLKLQTINPLLAPLALIIAAVGKDWPRVARGAWSSVRRVFEGRYGAPAKPDPYGAPYREPPRTGGTGRFTRKDDGND